MRAKKITVTDLAQLAGVSRATVSRVLNDNPNVNNEVRSKVLQAIEKSGYQRVNKTENASKLDKVLVIGEEIVLLSTNHFYEPIIRRLQELALERNLDLEFFIGDLKRDLNKLKNLLASAHDVIVIGTDDIDLMDLLAQYQVNVVLLNAIDPKLRFTSVMPDNEIGAFIATNYLIEKGHRNIKFLTSNVKHAMLFRTEGFYRALIKNGVPFSFDRSIIDLHLLADKIDPSGKLKNKLMHGSTTVDFSASLFYDYMIEHDYFKDVTAVFCMCDEIAVGLIKKFKEYGIRVPEDISVIGFDDITLSSITMPPLTTINSHVSGMPDEAFSLLERGNSGRVLPENMPLRVILPVTLIERGSVKSL